MDIILNGGVLIIGSLLWDTDDQRLKWRKNLLKVDERILVSAPIRYGRVSSERSCTFSMVFSNECNQDNKTGNAAFIPFRNNPINFKSLELHTKELIKSERKKDEFDNAKFNWGWGTLAIAVNPAILNESSKKYKEAKALLSFWGKNYSNGFNPEQYKVGNENPILNKQGILNLNWPEQLEDYDFLLATATKPEREVYPSSKNIADRMIVNEYSEYFYKNIQHGISTFQDKEIIGYMNSK